MAISPIPLVAEDEHVKQRREAENAQAPETDAGIVDMAWDLKGLHEAVDYGGLEFGYDPEFKLEQVKDVFGKQSKFVKDTVYEAEPKSREEFEYLTEKYATLERHIQEYQGEGVSFFAANMLASMFDPASLAVGVATGGLGVGYKLAKSTTGAVVAETVAAESAISAMRYANNPTYDVTDAVIDVAFSPLAAVPVYMGHKLSPVAKAARENAGRFAEAQNRALMEMQSGESQWDRIADAAETQHMPTNTTDDYKSGSKWVNWARTDRYKRLADAGIDGLSDKVSKIFEDAVGSWKDKQGQGATVDGVASRITESLMVKYNQEMHGATKELFGEIRKKMHQDGKRGGRLFNRELEWQEYEKSVKRIKIARENKDTTGLTPAEIKMMQIEAETFKRALRQMQDSGVKGADRIEHDPFYAPIQYDRAKILSFPKETVVGLFTKSFVAGTRDAGNELAEGQAKLLAQSMYHKITKAHDGETIYDMLDNPEEFLEYIRKDWDEIQRGANGKLDPEALEALLGKKGQDQPPMLRRRADLKRTEAIELPDGTALDVLDLTVSDGIQLTQGYVRHAAGLSGLSQGLGIKSMDEWRKFRQSIVDNTEVKRKAKENDAKRLLDDIENVAFGRASVHRTKGANVALNVTTGLMSAVGLGFAGAAALVDMAIATARSGLAASIRTMPPLKDVMTPKDIEVFAEAAASVDVFVNNTQWSNALPNLAEEGMEGMREGVVPATVRDMARKTVKYSGLSFMTEWTQRQAFYGSANKLFKEARKGKDFHLSQAETGWTNAETAHLKELMANSPTNASSDTTFGKMVKVPDLSNWSREDKTLLFRGLHKFSMRAASRVTRGEQGEWMELAVTRVLAQFRAVVINSFTKRALSGLMRMGTKQGAVSTVQSGLAQMASLHMLYWVKAEAKMLGMDESSRNEYIEKLGWDSPRDYDRMFNGSWEDKLDAYMKAPAAVIRQIASYSPSHGSVLELADLAAGAFGSDLTGARYRPTEDRMFGSPAIGYVENVGRLASGLTDGEFNAEDARRMRAAMWMNSHPLMMAASNSIIEAADLPKEKD